MRVNGCLWEHEQKQDNQQLQLIDQLQEFQKKVSSNLNLLNFEQKKEIVRLLVREVEVDIKAEEITVRHVVPKPKRLPLCTGSTITAAVKHRPRRFRQRA